MRPLIYVASPLSDLPFEYLKWLSKMNDTALDLFEMGWAPVIPGNDLLFCYRSPRELSKKEVLDMDFAYINACRAVYVIAFEFGDGRKSEGVLAECNFASARGIPIINSMSTAYNIIRNIRKDDDSVEIYPDFS